MPQDDLQDMLPPPGIAPGATQGPDPYAAMLQSQMGIAPPPPSAPQQGVNPDYAMMMGLGQPEQPNAAPVNVPPMVGSTPQPGMPQQRSTDAINNTVEDFLKRSKERSEYLQKKIDSESDIKARTKENLPEFLGGGKRNELGQLVDQNGNPRKMSKLHAAGDIAGELFKAAMSVPTLGQSYLHNNAWTTARERALQTYKMQAPEDEKELGTERALAGSGLTGLVNSRKLDINQQRADAYAQNIENHGKYWDTMGITRQKQLEIVQNLNEAKKGLLEAQAHMMNGKADLSQQQIQESLVRMKNAMETHGLKGEEGLAMLMQGVPPEMHQQIIQEWQNIQQGKNMYKPIMRQVDTNPVTQQPIFGNVRPGVDGTIPGAPIAGATPPPTAGGTLADRNNNPGNLRFDGQAGAIPGEGGFAKFQSPEAGHSALVADIKAKQMGLTKTGLSGNSTLGDFAAAYAPKSDHNDPVGYAASVAKRLGVTPQTPIGRLDPEQLAQAVSVQEGGSKAALQAAGPQMSVPSYGPNGKWNDPNEFKDFGPHKMDQTTNSKIQDSLSGLKEVYDLKDALKSIPDSEIGTFAGRWQKYGSQITSSADPNITKFFTGGQIAAARHMAAIRLRNKGFIDEMANKLTDIGTNKPSIEAAINQYEGTFKGILKDTGSLSKGRLLNFFAGRPDLENISDSVYHPERVTARQQASEQKVAAVLPKVKASAADRAKLEAEFGKGNR